MFALNTDDVLIRVRERIHDRTGQAFDDVEVLRALDDANRSIFDQLRIRSEDHGLDVLTVSTTTDVERIETGVWRYTLPEWVSDIQLVEAVGTGRTPVQIARASLEEKDLGRGTFRSTGTLWNWGPPGTIEIRGDLEAFISLRIWFIRAIPPMCYALGNAPGTTTTLLTDSSTSEGMLLRARCYEQQQFQVVAGAVADLNKLVRCTSFTVSAGVATMAFAPALSVATGTTTRMAMLVPLDPQHSEYLCDLAAMQLFERQASKEEVAMMAGRLARSESNFQMAIARRSSGEPPRLSSTRRTR